MDETSQIIKMVHLVPPAFWLCLFFCFWLNRDGDQAGHLLP